MGIFLIGIIIAPLVISFGRTITLDSKEELTKRGLDTINISHKNDSDYAWSELKHPTDEDFNMPSSPRFKTSWMNCTSRSENTWVSLGVNITLEQNRSLTDEELTFLNDNDDSICLERTRVNLTSQEIQDKLNEWDTQKIKDLESIWEIRSERLNFTSNDEVVTISDGR